MMKRNSLLASRRVVEVAHGTRENKASFTSRRRLPVLWQSWLLLKKG